MKRSLGTLAGSLGVLGLAALAHAGTPVKPYEHDFDALENLSFPRMYQGIPAKPEIIADGCQPDSKALLVAWKTKDGRKKSCGGLQLSMPASDLSSKTLSFMIKPDGPEGQTLEKLSIAVYDSKRKQAEKHMRLGLPCGKWSKVKVTLGEKNAEETPKTYRRSSGDLTAITRMRIFADAGTGGSFAIDQLREE